MGAGVTGAAVVVVVVFVAVAVNTAAVAATAALVFAAFIAAADAGTTGREGAGVFDASEACFVQRLFLRTSFLHPATMHRLPPPCLMQRTSAPLCALPNTTERRTFRYRLLHRGGCGVWTCGGYQITPRFVARRIAAGFAVGK